MKSLIIQCLIKFKMAIIRLSLWKPLLRKTHNPQQAQNKLLFKILNQNKHTQFARDHKFKDISDYKDYQTLVPVSQYDSLRAYIEKQETGKTKQLNRQQPVMYAQTSGSTGLPKYIPILKRTITQYRNSQHVVAYSIYSSIPEAYKGKILAIVSPATEGLLETGTPYGSMSGLIYNSMPTLMCSKYVLPPDIFEIQDYDEKYYQITLHAIAEKNISLIATANPSTLLKIEQVMQQNFDRLIVDIAKRDIARSKELSQLVTDKEALLFSNIWPNLKALVTWTAGSCGTQIPKLRSKLASTTRIVEMGYLSSEFRGGITLDVTGNRQIPAIDENFFEFVEKEEWENKVHNFKVLDQVEVGKQYYIFATTQNGLYRYDINDIIEVTGRFNNTPTIQFVQKGSGVVSLTGEKLYESQFLEAMNSLFYELGIEVGFFIMLGCTDNLEYILYIEHDPIPKFDIEHKLSLINIEYEAKFNSGRLKPTVIQYLQPGTGEIYKQYCLNNGQREGQFKLSYLQYKQDCSFDFDSFLYD